ncbi:hypothetical protein MKW98_030717 [Papaver atlanticum]|uniref:Uncharacterized protein n=1 Tax=Papaver atlanticum TaxID=357466 RepID=A0AAD4X2J8_9MAGN|nr:hypothetical protein MKW98_030717 [Papaver atlanticum]
MFWKQQNMWDCFLSSNVSAKQTRRFIYKLWEHLELAMRPSGSFIVEKCFTASNLSLRETVASELFAVRPELATHGQQPETQHQRESSFLNVLSIQHKTKRTSGKTA